MYNLLCKRVMLRNIRSSYTYAIRGRRFVSAILAAGDNPYVSLLVDDVPARGDDTIEGRKAIAQLSQLV